MPSYIASGFTIWSKSNEHSSAPKGDRLLGYWLDLSQAYCDSSLMQPESDSSHLLGSLGCEFRRPHCLDVYYWRFKGSNALVEADMRGSFGTPSRPRRLAVLLAEPKGIYAIFSLISMKTSASSWWTASLWFIRVCMVACDDRCLFRCKSARRLRSAISLLLAIIVLATYSYAEFARIVAHLSCQ